MLKRRIVFGLTLNDGVLFRTKRFEPDYRYTSNFVSVAADELAVIDVTPVGSRRGAWRGRFAEAARGYCDRAAAPMSVSCSITDGDGCRWAFNECGADKVLVGDGCELGFVSWMAETYGAQAVVVGLTLRPGERLSEEVARTFEAAGAGEFLLSDVERDGSLQGFNIEALKRLRGCVDVPVMVQGGCGSWAHMQAAFEAGADAAVTNNIFHFTDTAVAAAREFLRARGVPVRMPPKIEIGDVA